MNKKFIAIITALALVVTLLAPVGVQEASAKSKNNVDRVVTVTSDAYVGQDSALPYLTIVNEDANGSTPWGVNDVFRLELPSSAKWENVAAIQALPEVDNTSNRTRLITDQILQVTPNGVAPGDTMRIPLAVKLSGASGEIKVTVNRMDSRVDAGSYTFAVAESGATVVTVGKKETITRNSSTGAAIIIDETVAGALKGAAAPGKKHEFRVSLPSKFSWDKTVMESLSNIEFPANATSGSALVVNDRHLDVTFYVTTPSSTRQSIVITPRIIASRDASFGEVTATITNRAGGDISNASGLVIADYKDFGVSISIEEVKEFLAGYEVDDGYKTAKITIEETIANSLLSGRVIDFELPSWVKVTSGQPIQITNKTSGAGNASITPSYIDSKRSEFEVRVDEIGGNASAKKKLEIELPITIEANKTGDIELIVSGAGIEKQELVIGKAVAPVTAEVNVTDVRLGVQNQAAPDILITEAWAGAAREGKDITLTFANSQGFRFDSATFEVVEGDLEIDLDNSKRVSHDGYTNNRLQIRVKSESTEPSTIKISNIKLTLDRTVPEGPFNINVGGSSIVDNSYYDDFTGTVKAFQFANVITPAPGETRATSVFAIDSTNYTVIESGVEVERTMDVAPYIKDSRTFLPVFFVAQSLGVSENNIIWEPHTKTVTVIKGDRVAQMQIGNKVLTVNGTAIQMDTAPEIKDGRTMLPIFFIGQALGAQVEWDGDNRTVTVQQ